jgi:hypothetical protein
MTSSASLTAIAICQVLTALAGLATAVVLIYAVVSFRQFINRKVDEAMNRVQPIVDEAKSVAEQARETAEKVSEKVDTMVTRAGTTVDRVGDQVESVSAKVEEAISPQVIAVAGILGTAVKCAQIYKDIVAANQQPDGAKPEDES